MKKLALLGALLALFSLLGMRDVFSTSGEGIEVETGLVQLGPFNSSILASGQLSYREDVQLRSEIAGRVVEVLVQESDRVSKGQVVVRIDPTQFRKQVEQLQALVRMSKIAMEKQQLTIQEMERKAQSKQSLYDRRLIDEDSYRQAVADLQYAKLDLQEKSETAIQYQAQLENAQQDLNKTEIRAPIDGVVSLLDIKAGESVIAGATNIPGSVLLTISDPSQWFAEIHVDETDIARITLGQPVDVFVVAFPHQPFRGKVDAVAEVVSTAQRTQGKGFLVKVLLENPNQEHMRAGISCRAEIYYASQQQALTVPVQAVVFAQTGQGKLHQLDTHVFVEDNGIARQRSVQLGDTNDKLQEIRSGLLQGDRIITGPYRVLQKLQDGSKVSVTTESEQQS